jgi:ribonuclease P protein component
MEFSESLKKNRDFKTVYGHGKSRANTYLVMYVMKNGTERNRVGISVSKKVGNSIVRHRLTRLIRESYRLNEYRFIKGLDIVIVVRVSAKEIDYHTMDKALMHVAGIQRILEKGDREGHE